MNRIKAIVLLLCVSLSLHAMDIPGVVYVKTSDNKIVQVEQWMINHMPELMLLLEKQSSEDDMLGFDYNSMLNPLFARMVTAQQLELVTEALKSISEGSFAEFYKELSKQDLGLVNQLIEQKAINPTQGAFKEGLVMSLEEGKIRGLINGAHLLKAVGVSAFCLSFSMPADMANRLLVPLLIDQVVQMYPVQQIPLLDNENIFTMAFSSDRKKVVIGDMENEYLLLCDISNPEKVTSQRLQGHPDGVTAVAFSADGSKMVSGGFNNLIVWDLSKPAAIARHHLAGLEGFITAVALSADGTKVVAGCDGDQDNLMLWDISNLNGITNYDLAGHSGDVNAIAFSKQGNKVVSGCSGDQNNLILWDVSDLQAITNQVLKGNVNGVRLVAVSPDGTKMVSTSTAAQQDNCIVWDISNPSAITPKVLMGHDNLISAVAFSPDGTTMVSGGDTLIVWDITSFDDIKNTTLAGHHDIVLSAAFSADGKKIVSGGKDKIIVWDMSNSGAIKRKALYPQWPTVDAVSFSQDESHVLAATYAAHEPHNFVMYQLLPADIQNALETCNIAQAQFIYQMCLVAKQGVGVKLTSPYAIGVFATLSPEVKAILKDWFNIELDKVCIPDDSKTNCIIS